MVHTNRIIFSCLFRNRFRRGISDDRKIWSATALVNPEYHSILRQVHESFLVAGAHAITTNSYGVVPGVGFSVDEIQRYVTVAGRIAREAAAHIAVATTSCNKTPFVLGSMGPLVESYRPDKVLSHTEGVNYYKEIVKALLPFVDAFLAETMSCVEEASQAMDAIEQLSLSEDDAPSKPMLFVSFTLDSHGVLRNGASAGDEIRRLLDLTQEKKSVERKSYLHQGNVTIRTTICLLI